MNIFHTPWWITLEDFVGKQSSEETMLQSLSLYSRGLWKLNKYEPLLSCPKPTCRPADTTNSSMATLHNYYTSLPSSFGVSSWQPCQSGFNNRWTRRTSGDWKNPCQKSFTLWPTSEEAVTAQPHGNQQPHWAPISELADLRLFYSHAVVCHTSPWTWDHKTAKFPLPSSQLLSCLNTQQQKQATEELTTACSSAAEGAEASKDLQLLWSPELKLSKHETFAWTTQKEVQEAGL